MARRGEREHAEDVLEGRRDEDGVQDVLRELREACRHPALACCAFSVSEDHGDFWGVWGT